MTDKQSAIDAAAMAIANCLTVGWDGIHKDKAHWRETHGMLDGIYSDVNGPFQDDCREAARAAILALRQWMDAEGLVVVPREATERMFRAGSLFRLTSPVEVSGYKDTVGIYAAMIAAAPDALKATDSAQDGGE